MIMEILVPNAAVRNLIREDKIHQIYSSMQSGQEKFGMQTFNQSLATAYFQKQISLETAMARSSNVDELQEMINRGASLLNRPTAAGTYLGPRSGSVQALKAAADSKNICSKAVYKADTISEEKLNHASFYIFRQRRVRTEDFRGADGGNKQSLAQALRRERITPGAIREKGKEFSMPTFGSGKVRTKDIAIFFRQFSVMIDAGLPLVQCLEILAANQENQAFQKTS